MEVTDAIKTRRSIRKYKAKPIDDATLRKVLEAAQWAPTWANTQCGRFIVVKDQKIKDALADAMAAPTSSGANALRTAPVMIVACAELGKSGFRRTPPTEPATDKEGYWYMFDVALAMENVALAAHGLGLGGVHLGLFDAKKAAAAVQVPAGFCVVEMYPLGYPDETKTSVRKELSEIISVDRFGNAYK
jgi:nitroreductase